MLRESLYFSFAGIKSTDFGIYNISISEGLYDEQLAGNKTINEVSIRGRVDPYFVDVTEEPKIIQLRFSFLENYDDRLIDEVVRWLNVDYYQPLFFSEDIDRVFYAMPINGIHLIHNGLKEGYLELTMRCNSSRSFSHNIVTPIIEQDSNASLFQTIEIANKGHYPIYPDIWITKNNLMSDVFIRNLSNNNKEFRFRNIMPREKLFVDCQNEIIQTDIENVYRYDNFNDNFLELVYGVNVLEISNNAEFQFRYRYEFS